MDISVAGLPIRVHSADETYFAGRFAEYERTDGSPPVLEIRTTLLDEIPTPQGKDLGTIEGVQLVDLPDGRFCRYKRDEETGQILFAIATTRDYASSEIQLWANRQNPYFTQTDWEYMYTGFSFKNRLTVLGGEVLHSSALALDGQGVAFSAPSGTGKSTHVGLWRQVFGDRVTVINDDKPALRFTENGVMIYGTPWSGKTAENTNCRVPLKAIVFIERGQENRLERLSPLDGMIQLAGQISRPYYDAGLGQKSVEFIQRLSTAVPMYRMTCNMDPEAARVAYRGIFEEETK